MIIVNNSFEPARLALEKPLLWWPVGSDIILLMGGPMAIAIKNDVKEYEAKPLAEVADITGMHENEVLREAAAGNLRLFLWFGKKKPLLTTPGGFLFGWFSPPRELMANILSGSDEDVIADKLYTVDGDEVIMSYNEYPDKFMKRLYAEDSSKFVVSLKRKNLRIFPEDLEQLLANGREDVQDNTIPQSTKNGKFKSNKGKRLDGWTEILEYVNDIYPLGWSIDQLMNRYNKTKARWKKGEGTSGKPVYADSVAIDNWIKKHNYA